MPKENEIVICEITKSGCSPRYRLQKSYFGTFLNYVDSPNRTLLGYPFEILLWGLPVLFGAEYKEGKTLEVPSENLEKIFCELVTGSLFSSNNTLEAELMRRYKREFPAEYKKHFG
jgi:hypothetical protein